MKKDQITVDKIVEILGVHSFALDEAFNEETIECYSIKDSGAAKELFLNSLDKRLTHHSQFTEKQQNVFLKWVELSRNVEEIKEAYNTVYCRKLRNVAIRRMYEILLN